MVALDALQQKGKKQGGGVGGGVVKGNALNEVDAKCDRVTPAEIQWCTEGGGGGGGQSLDVW
jgi:hypothetical protein